MSQEISTLELACVDLLTQIVDAVVNQSNPPDKFDWLDQTASCSSRDEMAASVSTDDVEDLESAGTCSDNDESLDQDEEVNEVNTEHDCGDTDDYVPACVQDNIQFDGQVELADGQSSNTSNRRGGGKAMRETSTSAAVAHSPANSEPAPKMEHWIRPMRGQQCVGYSDGLNLRPVPSVQWSSHYLCEYKAKYTFYLHLSPNRYSQFVRMAHNNDNTEREVWQMVFDVFTDAVDRKIVHMGEIHAFYQMETLSDPCHRTGQGLRWMYKDFNFYPSSFECGKSVSHFKVADVFSRLIKLLAFRDTLIKQFPYLDMRLDLHQTPQASVFNLKENIRKMMNRIAQINMRNSGSYARFNANRAGAGLAAKQDEQGNNNADGKNGLHLSNYEHGPGKHTLQLGGPRAKPKQFYSSHNKEHQHRN